MSLIGYARVSTTDQNLESQIDQLVAAGCLKIYQEKVSGVKQDRPELAAMLDYVREGDVVIVTKLDRIGRSTKHLLDIVEKLKAKAVGFKALNNKDLDTTSATGKMMLTILAAVATFEREMMLERQAEGIRIAKAAGKYRGRKATAQAKYGEIRELAAQGMKREDIAVKVGVGVASVYRALKDNLVSPKRIDNP
ncbi:resolvase [Geobacter sp. OR-1]|uniref:recombinase family protein n=1 Tax=Geobacter sp. OR-1 TaxID=1266765 RepID=UPI000541A86D|nr:recombinase family protein [Geobacter sp. OR-1]GAM09486.1 resolvase [Geobacter sp. OR-1]